MNNCHADREIAAVVCMKLLGMAFTKLAQLLALVARPRYQKQLSLALPGQPLPLGGKDHGGSGAAERLGVKYLVEALEMNSLYQSGSLCIFLSLRNY